MAFEEVTLFEFDLEGAQFGPRELPSTGTEDAPAHATDSPSAAATTGEAADDDESSGGAGRVLALVVAALVVSVVATVLARRLTGDGEQTTVDEFAGESVEVEDGESLT